MGMGAGKRGKRGGMVEINMTPLVDVMLVLLVVFMVAAPLLAAAAPIDNKPMVLSITTEGRAFLGETEISGDVRKGLLSDPRSTQGLPLYVRADKDARYGYVARAMAEARSAGITAVTLLVEEVADHAVQAKP
jgi:biopolymer transport protein TolR